MTVHDYDDDDLLTNICRDSVPTCMYCLCGATLAVGQSTLHETRPVLAIMLPGGKGFKIRPTSNMTLEQLKSILDEAIASANQYWKKAQVEGQIEIKFTEEVLSKTR